MKNRRSAPIADADLRVIEELWSRGEASIRDLRDSLYPGGGNSEFSTVQKLLSRLAAKGLVRRRKHESNWVYRAVVAREDLIGGELRRVAGRFGGESLSPLLTFLVEAGGLTQKERAHLRSLLDDKPDKSRDRASGK